jgi:hypothetical protein
MPVDLGYRVLGVVLMVLAMVILPLYARKRNPEPKGLWGEFGEETICIGFCALLVFGFVLLFFGAPVISPSSFPG